MAHCRGGEIAEVASGHLGVFDGRLFVSILLPFRALQLPSTV